MNSMKSNKVLIVGSATIDEIVVDDKRMSKAGGVATYAGLTFKRHGLETTVATNIADSDTAIQEIFHNESIRLLSRKTQQTTRFVNVYKGKHREQSLSYKAQPITIEQIMDEIPSFDHVHLGPLHPKDIHKSIYRHLALKKKFVSTDIQGLVRYVREPIIKLKTSSLLTMALRISTIVKADMVELREILRFLYMTVTDLMRVFSFSELVVTAGSRGGMIISRRQGFFRYRAVRPEAIVDTTGAGDVFFAAYLVSRIYRQQSIRQACHYASKLVAKHIEEKYFTSPSSTVEQVNLSIYNKN
jgi:sugar/nucleoside kinase (ribokinase family)